MELLVDGYNLFKQVVGASLLSSAQMAHYIALFTRYVQQKQLSALLIFDGGMQERQIHEEQGMVQVIYVGKNKTADDFIKDYLQQCANKNILLVSSDRELNRVADYYNVPSIDALDFWHFVRQALAKKEQQVKKTTIIVKWGDTNNAELDALMITSKASVPKVDDSLDVEDTKQLKRSKVDKKLLQKVKKL